MKYSKVLIAAFLISTAMAGFSYAADLKQLAGVIHVHSTFDNAGHYSIDQLVEQATRAGLEVLIPTDHDLQKMEYGIFPLRNIIKKTESRKSIISGGPGIYLEAIKRLNTKQKNVLIIPGAQSSPFYYWSGNPLKGELDAYDYRKELLLIGLDEIEDYTNLPLLHNGFSMRYFSYYLPQPIIFIIALCFSIFVAISKRKPFKIIGTVLVVVSLLFILNSLPFHSSKFDPFHGDQGIGPFQELIDYTGSVNGLVFWAHPESKYAADGTKIGPVTLKTQPYPDALLESQNYTGFSTLYGDNITATNPGRQWDKVLLEYCQGDRTRPAWGIAGADFHSEQAGVEIDTFQTVFMVKRKDTESVMDALAKGRTYAVLKGTGSRLALDQYFVKEVESGAQAISGGTVRMMGTPIVEGRVTSFDGSGQFVKGTIIKEGKIVHTFEGETPVEFSFIDKTPLKGRTYYRIDVNGFSNGKLVSNPIFAEKGKP